MKLAYLHTNPISSTQANIIQVLYMCDALSKHGIDVELIVPNSGENLSEVEKDILIDKRISKKRNFQVNEYRRSGLFSRFRVIDNYFGLRRKILDTQADVFFTRTPIILPLLKRLNKKAIFESHSPLLQNSFGIVDSFYKFMLQRQMEHNSRLLMITISQALKKYWVNESYNDSKIFVLHDAFDDSQILDDSFFEEGNKEDNDLNKSIIVTYIGSLYKDRGIDRLFTLAKKFPQCQFLVAGGPEEQSILFKKEAKKSKLTNLDFLGWLDREEVNNLMSRSHILLMLWSKDVPTINYCSPMKVFEYMSSGKTIVGDGYPTIKEVLTDGINAHLSIPDSNKSLISKLEIAINEVDDNSMGQKAKELAFKEYTWKNRALAVKKIINNIH